MDKLTTQEEYFLSYLLKSACNETSPIQGIINIKIIDEATNLLLRYFENEDTQNISNHVTIIRKTFIDGYLTSQNCVTEVGISKKTFYRYKERYLQVFRNFLIQCLDP